MPSRQPRKPSIGLNSCSCLDALGDHLRRHAQLAGHLLLLALVVVRQELVQRRIERADRHRPALHRLEQALEVARAGTAAAWPAPSRGPPACSARIISRNRLDVVEEHVLGAAQADALGAEGDGLRGLVRLVGVGAHASACGARRPSPSAWRTAGRPRDCSGLSVLSISTCTTSLGLVATWPAITSPVKPSMLMKSPSLSTLSPTVTVPLVVVDVAGRRSRRCRPCPSAG